MKVALALLLAQGVIGLECPFGEDDYPVYPHGSRAIAFAGT